jgi:hypothetical protein
MDAVDTNRHVIIDLEADYVEGSSRPGGDAADARWVEAAGLGCLRLNAGTAGLLRRRFGFGR